MAVGFKYGTTDLESIFLTDADFTNADVLAKFKAGGSLSDAYLLDGQAPAYYKCTDCTWTCSGTCTGGCRTGCTGGCLTGCTSCTGTCTGTCTGCGTGCASTCTGGCAFLCTDCSGH